jgi:DNA-binding NarL/FixJ family response regulator
MWEAAGLTAREVHILELLAAGLTADAIGRHCGISPRTVGKHLENIYAKLGCHDRLTAVLRVLESTGPRCMRRQSTRGLAPAWWRRRIRKWR